MNSAFWGVSPMARRISPIRTLRFASTTWMSGQICACNSPLSITLGLPWIRAQSRSNALGDKWISAPSQSSCLVSASIVSRPNRHVIAKLRNSSIFLKIPRRSVTRYLQLSMTAPHPNPAAGSGTDQVKSTSEPSAMPSHKIAPAAPPARRPARDVIDAVVENMRTNLEQLKYSTLAPSRYTVYLHPTEYARLEGIVPIVQQQTIRDLSDE